MIYFRRNESKVMRRKEEEREVWISNSSNIEHSIFDFPLFFYRYPRTSFCSNRSNSYWMFLMFWYAYHVGMSFRLFQIKFSKGWKSEEVKESRSNWKWGKSCLLFEKWRRGVGGEGKEEVLKKKKKRVKGKRFYLIYCIGFIYSIGRSWGRGFEWFRCIGYWIRLG